MCSSPHAREPKLQLAVEQLLTGGLWNLPKKDTPCPKTKMMPQWDCRWGTITIKSNPIPSKWVTHKLENNNTKEILPLLWGSEPTSGFPAWGPNQRTGNPQGIWPWRPVGFDYKTSTGLGETETPVSEGTNKTLQVIRLRGKEQWLHRRLNQSYLLVLDGFLWRHGSGGVQHRDSGTGSSSLGMSPLT